MLNKLKKNQNITTKTYLKKIDTQLSLQSLYCKSLVKFKGFFSKNLQHTALNQIFVFCSGDSDLKKSSS